MRRSSRWASSNLVLIVVAIATVAALAGLVLGGRPISMCWMGIGPAPEPQTSECEAAFVAGLSPFERLEYDSPLLAAALIAAAVFLALLAVVLVARVATRRWRGSR